MTDDRKPVAELWSENARLFDENVALRAALSQYGRHTDECMDECARCIPRLFKCICGFTAALTKEGLK